MRLEKKPAVKLEGWEKKRGATYETNHLGVGKNSGDESHFSDECVNKNQKVIYQGLH